ncbi:MAG: DUF1641 domain-containing protein [Candidatus Aramenus sp.]|nr:DUF1641 domain-containing protein [Candidatus Aramenus sp.]
MDNLLTGDKILTVNHLMNLLEKLDKLGLIDVVSGILDDEEYLGKIMGAIVNDRTIALASNWNNLVELLDMLSNETTKENMQFAMNMISQLRKSGIVDPLLGLLNDEEYMSKIMGAIVNDKVLSLLGRWNSLVELLDVVTNDDNLASIKKVLGLLSDLQRSGILDPIAGILKDEETIGKVVSGLVNDFTLNLLNNWDQIMKDLSKLNLENFKYYTVLVNEIGDAIKTESVKPLGLMGLLSALRDPDVQKGVGLVISILKHIGRNYNSM